ncbi:MAG TPA: histidine kinase [Arenimonas sp.]|uniref:sensor histidine kinase n=1 Tax=Arenimonas sp. TaxID=1872635 RepID=UPI002D80FEB4|nr:histidine kinase [Arenimonas sp.]HEU0153021.1 histidine kinase [Arenimonas sp.]
MAGPAPSDTHPLDALWQANAIVWLIICGEGLAAVLALTPGLATDRLVYFGLASLWIQWTTLLTLALLYLARHWLSRLGPPQVAAIALVLALGVGWVITFVIRAYLEPGAGPHRVDWLALALQVSGITLAVGLLGLAAFHNHWQGRVAASRAKQAQLEALQARIRPHFLFNTLNTGAALVHARPGEAEQLLLDLSDLFRAALSGESEIPLADELALARRYLEIEALRFGPRLRLSWNVPDPVPGLRVPTLSIQPLVENAIRHGVEPAADGGAVDVSVASDGRHVTVTVANDLPSPRSGARPAHAGHQVGLASVRSRIEALTEGRGRLEAGVSGGRYVATLILPL